MPRRTAERFKPRRIENRALLKRFVARGSIESHRFNARLLERSTGHAHRGAFQRIAIDLQINCHGLVLFRQPGEQKVFEPDARVKHFRLMTGEKREACRARHIDIAIGLGVAFRRGEQFASRVVGQLRKRPPLNIVIRSL